jgi:plastocyanin
MRPRRVISMGIVLGALALLAAACGGGGEAATPDENGRVVIELSEFQFSPNEITVTAGQEVTFVLRNVGEKEHEFMVGHDVDTDEGFPNGFHDNFFTDMSPMVSPMDAAMGMEDMGDMEGMSTDTTMGDMGDGSMDEMEHHGFMVMRDPDEEATITFTVPEDAVGEWDIGCFEEDGAHWDDGMKGTLTVVEG